jgi:hypothetical protein
LLRNCLVLGKFCLSADSGKRLMGARHRFSAQRVRWRSHARSRDNGKSPGISRLNGSLAVEYRGASKKPGRVEHF